ncbi:hypothetical protein ACVGVM_09775 [Pseudonocardia bannensis]|uniref:Uncharacterized protein n=1 Tax=Pseudonocardia bannensis TaxID=630973 RepID=A0A848DRW6_9PSEU|nr:hypothetical protein [Pseudonocardia bannensis]NMH95265.1 hypothetical protein [Pseudonocardia bannensis]
MVVATGLALAGCASDPAPTVTDPGPATTAPAEGASVEWTGTVCSALVPVVEALRTPPAPDLADPAATKQAYSSYLAQALQEAERAVQDVTAAGPAPVEGGEQIAREVREQVTQLRDDLAEARAQVDQADPGDPAALGRAVTALGNTLASLGNSAQALTAVADNPRLEPAFRQAPSCQQLREIGTP